LIFGIAFSTMLMSNQVAIFSGLMLRTASQILDAREADIWVMDPRVEYVDEMPLGRKLIRQPLHALTAGGAHVGDLRHGEPPKQREAWHEAERTAAPTGDEPCLLAEGPYLEEALGHFEHQLGDRLSLAVND